MAKYTVVSPKKLGRFFKDDDSGKPLETLTVKRTDGGQLVAIVHPNGSFRATGITVVDEKLGRGFSGLSYFGGYTLYLGGSPCANCLLASRFEVGEVVHVDPDVEEVASYRVVTCGGRKGFSASNGKIDFELVPVQWYEWRHRFTGVHIFLVRRQGALIGAGFVEAEGGRYDLTFSPGLESWCVVNKNHGPTILLADKLEEGDEVSVVRLAT